MVQYVKLHLRNKNDGSFALNAVLVKSIVGNTVKFNLIYKQGDMVTNPAGSVVAGALQMGETSFRCESGVVRAVEIPGSAIDSFNTVLLRERLRSESPFANYNVGIIDGILTGSEVFTVNLDDLFAIEQRREQESSGVLIKPGYTTDEIYSGFGSYHENHRTHRFNTPVSRTKPYLIGVELEVYAKDRSSFDRITTARTNWFQCERDGSLCQRVLRTTNELGKTIWVPNNAGVGGLGIEIKTIPLRPEDATSVDFWAEPMGKLAENAVTKAFNSTGLHVHISREILGDTEEQRQQNLSKLITFYTYYVDDDPVAREKNVTICGRERGYSDEKPKTEHGDWLAKNNLLGVVAKENPDAYNEVANEVKELCRTQRSDINIQHWTDYKTIEFRKGKGIISKTRLAAICGWWEQMCLYVKETHPRDFSFDNFFNRVCQTNPAVAFFFQTSEEQ